MTAYHSRVQAIDPTVLLQAPLLKRLPRDDLLALASRATIERFNARQPIFHQGEPGNAFHVILEGSVRIVAAARGGGEQTLAHLGRGDCFGELAILDGRERSASALAVEDSVLASISRAALRDWLALRPQAALALLETMSLRLRRTNQTLVELAFSDVEHRLARQLLRLAADAGAAGFQSAEFAALRITQSELGSMLSVSRESVNKQLKLFARRGWIELGRGHILIRMPERLAELEGD